MTNFSDKSCTENKTSVIPPQIVPFMKQYRKIL